MFGKSNEAPETQIFRIGELSFDAKSGELASGRGSRRLEPRPAAVLTCLCRVPGQLLSREELLDYCWGGAAGSDEALTQTVAQVRRAIQALGGDPRQVETLARRGYRLSGWRGAAAPQLRGPGLRWKRALTAVLVAGVAVVLIAYPHAIRHNVRQLLGMGSAPAPAHP